MPNMWDKEVTIHIRATSKTRWIYWLLQRFAWFWKKTWEKKNIQEKKEIEWTDQLAEELHKPIKRKFTKRKVLVNGLDDIWSADLVDMQSFAQHNNGVKYLLNVIDVFRKYAWSVPLLDKTGNTITNAFDNIIEQSNRKPNKLWVDQGSEFFNRVMDKWLKDNHIMRYTTFNEGKAVVVERFNRTIKTRMWKYFSANNTYKYVDVLDELIRQYNNSRHTSIKMKPIEASKKINEKKNNTNMN